MRTLVLSAIFPRHRPAPWAIRSLLILAWAARERSRVHLRRLDDRLLADVGLSREDQRRAGRDWTWLP